MSEYHRVILIFNTKDCSDIILVMFIECNIHHGLKWTPNSIRSTGRLVSILHIFMFLSIIAFVVFGFAASEFVVISFRSDSIDTGTVNYGHL